MNANRAAAEGEDGLSRRDIGCAFTVSNELGAGFLEAVYANAFCIELQRQSIPFGPEKRLDGWYKDIVVGCCIADVIVAGVLLVEIKALRTLTSDHDAQLMSYLRATRLTVGLLLSFGRPKMQVRRLVWRHDDTPVI